MVQKDLDIVYLVKDSERNEELRYSLRSVEANFPHARVVIVGFKPSWVQNVYHIRVPQSMSKRDNIMNNWHFISRDDEITEDFVLFNDDFFVVDPMDEIGPTIFGGLEDHIKDLMARDRKPVYINRLDNTFRLLYHIGKRDIKSFEMHIPMPFNKDKLFNLFKVVSEFEVEEFEVRSMYGNFYDLEGEKVADCKIEDGDRDPRWFHPFISTTDASFTYGEVGRYIRERFPNKSRYEV